MTLLQRKQIVIDIQYDDDAFGAFPTEWDWTAIVRKGVEQIGYEERTHGLIARVVGELVGPWKRWNEDAVTARAEEIAARYDDYVQAAMAEKEREGGA